MPRGRRARAGGMVALAKDLERSRDRIQQLREEIQDESTTFARLLEELHRRHCESRPLEAASHPRLTHARNDTSITSITKRMAGHQALASGN